MSLKRNRKILFATSSLLAVYLIGSIAAGFVLAEGSLHLPKRPVNGRVQFEEVLLKQFHTDLQDVAISAPDGVQLKGWYAKPEHFNGGTVVLFHGITDNRTGVAGYSRMFLKHGYAVLLPDARAHGDSGGDIATYGVKERYDVLRWTQWIQKSTAGCVYLFGESLGAAIALEATAVTPNLCAVAVESPFSKFREIAYDRIAEHAHISTWIARIVARPAVESALLYTRIRYGVDLGEANPEDALESSTVPTLLIHGTADHNIPIRHSYELMRTCGSHTRLWIVKGADHGGAVNVAPGEFESRLVGWFQSHPSPAVQVTSTRMNSR